MIGFSAAPDWLMEVYFNWFQLELVICFLTKLLRSATDRHCEKKQTLFLRSFVQRFRQRLSRKTVTAYATMPISVLSIIRK